MEFALNALLHNEQFTENVELILYVTLYVTEQGCIMGRNTCLTSDKKLKNVGTAQSAGQ